MPQVPAFAYVIAAAVLFFLLGWIAFRIRYEKLHGQAGQVRQELLEDARKDASDLLKAAKLEAKEEFYQARTRFDQETDRIRTESTRRQETLDFREDNLSKKVAFIDQKEARLDQLDENLRTRQEEMDRDRQSLSGLIAEQNTKLEQVAGMSADHAKNQLMENMVGSARLAASKSIQQVREETERSSRREAIKILSLAIQRYASEHVAERTISVVDLPNDEMKGRIIGREGRNIRAFETATGVEVIVDDTPEAVILSGFDSIRREIARIALERLVSDGRIHPARIEEVVKKTQLDMEEIIQKAGEQAAYDVGVHGVHPKVLYYLGRLRYRTSYGQNVLQHSKEVAYLSGLMAGELDLDEVLARRAGLLHDLGKAADQEMEGTHTQIGLELARRFEEGEIVQNAIAAHHEDVPAISLITVLVSAADAISGARPGARRETLESYVHRLERLEEVADSFAGVEKAYAIQAGREIRVIVDSGSVGDAYAEQLASDISEKIQAQMEYPGQIKVTVIRETRAVDYAR
ncbi:MAG: ribonuclease Y [Candidatus Latescibacteria bacterium]|nr:ribonuclease Y [Candidatus Latescibacterota bacterium]